MSTYLDANNETCDLPLVLVIPQLLQWYAVLVLSHFLDNKRCPQLYISNKICFHCYVVDKISRTP